MAYDWEKLKKRAEQIDNLFGGSKTVTTSEVKRLGKAPVSTSSDNFVSKSIKQKKQAKSSFTPTAGKYSSMNMGQLQAERDRLNQRIGNLRSANQGGLATFGRANESNAEQIRESSAMLQEVEDRIRTLSEERKTATRELRRYNEQTANYFDVPLDRQENTTPFDIDPASIWSAQEDAKKERELRKAAWQEEDRKPVLFFGSIGQTANAAPGVLTETAGKAVSLQTSEEYQNALSRLREAERVMQEAAEAATETARSRFPDATDLDFFADGDPAYEAAKLEVEAAQAAVDAIAAKSVVDVNSPAMKAYAEARDTGARFLEGMTPGEQFFGQTALSIGQNLAYLPTALINPSAPLVLMGASAAADKSYDLNTQGVPATESLIRGAVSGGIEAATEKIPLDNVLSAMKGGTGRTFIENMLRQAGLDATEEGIAYTANYIADKAANDPNATFSVQELVQSAAAGGLSGLFFGSGSSLIGSGVDISNARNAIGTNQDIVNRVNQRLAQPGQVMSDFMNAGLSLPTVSQDSADVTTYVTPTADSTKNTAATGGAGTGLVPLTEQAATNLSTGKNNIVAKTISDIISFVKRARAKKGGTERLYMGTIPDASAQFIYGETGIDVSGYTAVLPGSSVQHIFKNHGSEATESPRGQRAVTDSDIALIPRVLAEPDSVVLSGDTDAFGRQVLLFSKQIGDNYVTAQAVTDGRHMLSTNSLWIQKKKNPLVTVSDAGVSTDPAHNAQSVPPSGSPVISVRPDGQKVNTLFTGTEYSMSEAERASLMAQEPGGPAMLPTFEQQYGPESSVGAARYGFDPYTNLQGKYGTLPEGEKPSRIVDVPARTSDKSKASLTARTVMEAAATPDYALPDVAQLVVDGRLSYMPISNNQRAVMAESKIKNVGYSDALANWTGDVRAGKSSADLVAMGAQLYNAAVNAGDTKAAMDILYDYTRLIRSGAQATQAARILKTLTPAGTLYMIQKEVNNINEAQSSKKKRNVSSLDNVPVEIWMQRVGENLADELSRRIEAPKNQTQTVAQTILSDLRRYANETVPKRLQSGKTRTEMDRIMDLFQNKTAYNEAWAAAKDTLSDTFENDPDALAAFDDWLNQSLDYTKALTKELTKQSNIVISEELADAFLKADTEEARARALNAIYQNVADQMSSTWLEKFNALRYTNMLGNFKTQGRNLSGNVVMKGVRAVKVKQAAAIEAIASKVSGGKIQRSTTFLRDKDLYKEALSDFENVKPFAMGAGKYSDSAISSPMSEINARRAIFKNSGVWGTLPTSSTAAKALRKATDIAWKVPESYRVATDWLMNNKYFGDEAFSRSAYADALSRYLKANGITAEQMKSGSVDPALLERAREKAISAAREATFRDNNQFAEAISSIGFRNPDTLAKKAINAGVQGTMPFLRTPANVFVTAERYSPLGIVNTAIQAARVARGSDQVSWNDVIDSLSSTLTGTGIFLLGMFLRDQGWLVGGSDDDDKQASFDDLTGKQEYALVLPDGQSFTLDWLSPVSMPLFIGVEYADAAAEGGISTEDALNAAKSMSDVLLNMSMMQGINDQLTDISYSEYPLFDFALNSLLGYLQQGLTNSLLGQAERALEPIRMTTYTDKNLPLPTDIQYALGKASARIPGWDYQQIPYIDAWGRTESNGPLPLRMFNNFLNPAYTSQENVTPLDAEIQRIYDATGDKAVIPNRADKEITVATGVKMLLTGDEYVRYATDRGQMSYEIGSDLLENDIFQSLTDQHKADVLDNAYSYADAIAKSNISAYQPETWIQDAEESGVDPALAILYRYSDAKDDTKLSMLLEDDSLSKTQKNALQAFSFSQMSDAAQEKWPTAQAFGFSYEDYVKYYPICAASGAGKTKAVIIQDLVDAGMDPAAVFQFWNIVRK